MADTADAEKYSSDRAAKLRNDILGDWGHFWRSATKVNETVKEACFLTCFEPNAGDQGEWFRVPLLKLEVEVQNDDS